MRREKPLPRESSFSEFSENRSNDKSNSRGKFGGASKSGFGGNRSGRSGAGRSGGSFGGNRGNSGSGDREMFDATCSKCSKACKVPFKPTGEKPVLCSDCFSSAPRRDNPSRGRDGGFKPRSSGNSFKPRNGGQNFSRQSSGDREMFDATCSKCGKACKVPFKPTSGKPVSCSDCFVKRDSGSRGGGRSFGGGKSFGNNQSFGNRRR